MNHEHSNEKDCENELNGGEDFRTSYDGKCHGGEYRDKRQENYQRSDHKTGCSDSNSGLKRTLEQVNALNSSRANVVRREPDASRRVKRLYFTNSPEPTGVVVLT